ncbi:phenolic acid decarboxylase [Enterobacter cancerogenus]
MFERQYLLPAVDRPRRPASRETLCYQNEFVEDMHRFCDEDPANPDVVLPEFSTVTYMKNKGPHNDAVICMPTGQLPAISKENRGAYSSTAVLGSGTIKQQSDIIALPLKSMASFFGENTDLPL